MPDPAPLPAVSRHHLETLTDSMGILQHAIGSRPDPAHGYCTDDVARALIVDLLHARAIGWSAVGESAWRSLRFLEAAFEPTTGRFRNFRDKDGAWLPGEPSEDSNGRAMLALGQAMSTAPEPRLAAEAAGLFLRALPVAQGVQALRAQASVLLGCHAARHAAPSDEVARAYRLLSGRLGARFRSRTGAAWPWPESRLTYENALPVHALIVAGADQGSASLLDDGLALLDWLIRTQMAPAGHLSPIGNGWWPCGDVRSQFDQQPIEATSLLLAAEAAFRETNDERYVAAAERSLGWFLGQNDLEVAVADPARGSCGDGLTPTGVNTNEGAESTLMWLTALEHVRAIRDVRQADRATRDGSVAGAAT